MDAQEFSKLKTPYGTCAEDILFHIADGILNADITDEMKPGITLVLNAILHMDEITSERALDELLATQAREQELQRIAEWIRTSPVYRVRVAMPTMPSTQTVGYVEASHVAGAASMEPDPKNVVEVRRAVPEDAQEALDLDECY